MPSFQKQSSTKPALPIQPPQSRKALIYVGLIVITFVILLGTTKAASHYISDRIFHQTAVIADKHAITAGSVMNQNNLDIPTSEVAYKVVGTAGDTTIDALVATGSTYDGSVTLRVSVTDNSGLFGSSDQAIRCYTYAFRHTADALTPKRLSSCPTSAPLKLSAPLSVELPSNSQILLQNTLDALTTTQRSDVTIIRNAVTASFPLPLSVIVNGTNTHGYSVSIKAGPTQCISANITPAGVVTVNSPTQGADCMGG